VVDLLDAISGFIPQGVDFSNVSSEFGHALRRLFLTAAVTMPSPVMARAGCAWTQSGRKPDDVQYAKLLQPVGFSFFGPLMFLN
jgi:hypothetical protein